MRLRKALAALAIGGLLATGASACDLVGGGTSTEVEDCDAEDYANREDDCGFTDADRKKKPVKKPAAPPKKKP